MRKWLKRWTAFILAVSMLVLPGCGSRDNGPAGEDGQQDAPVSAAEKEEEESKEKTMGRYLEQEVTLPEDMTLDSYPKICMKLLDNGEVALLEQTAGLYTSADLGETWNRKEAPWLKEIGEAYILHMMIAPNGAVAVIYSGGESEDGEEGFHPKYLYADPDGNAKKLAYTEDEDYLHRFYFDKDSRLYGYALSGKVCEADLSEGSFKQVFETEGMTDYACATERYMVNITSRGIVFYDKEDEMVTDEDRVLQDFIMEHEGDGIGSNADAYSVVAAAGEQEDVLYFALSSGLYRHVIGGTALEQVVDGALSSMGDPMLMFQGMEALPDNEFMVLYTGGKLCRYVYDPDIPTVPDQQVDIYGLTENYAVRQAVSLFQKQHPEVYIRYEQGLSEAGGMTTEDAIKNLNTRIMSGSGPDLLVLDGLPLHSYIEKGVLADLGSLAKTFTGEDALFSNIVDGCKEDGKLWYLPVRFRLPMIMGDKDMLAKVTDLRTLADAVEALRKENPEGMLLGKEAEEDMLRTLAITCSAAWTDPKTGTINEEKLTEFLKQAKRIYDAEVSGVDEDTVIQAKESYERNKDESWARGYFSTISSGALYIGMGEQKLTVGVGYMMNSDFTMVTTVADMDENLDYGVWQGEVKDGFIPQGLIGICAGAEENELAAEFFRFLFGRELQDIDMSTGFPVNQASFEKLRENPRKDDENISLSVSSKDGPGFSLEVKWSNDEDFEKLKTMAGSASGLCMGDARIESTVCEVGARALKGSISVEDAVREILKKSAIYLAE